MSVSFIIFTVIHIAVLAFFVELLRRTAIRAREYPLEDTSETIPFGILKLRYIIILYILVYIAWIVFSFWLYSVFLGGDILLSPKASSLKNVILDL
ncbi:hypothetical protein KJ742_00490 [Patescibacteria group bacterium]|nr:hypothetical protein [Patescibacteria group bacterium]MBU1682402.1 hypothetical protein [Patescibacteria group bacterium]MBU1934623.1 hypothetical protein [Patescibacteria group bacterium]